MRLATIKCGRPAGGTKRGRMNLQPFAKPWMWRTSGVSLPCRRKAMQRIGNTSGKDFEKIKAAGRMPFRTSKRRYPIAIECGVRFAQAVIEELLHPSLRRQPRIRFGNFVRGIENTCGATGRERHGMGSAEERTVRRVNACAPCLGTLIRAIQKSSSQGWQEESTRPQRCLTGMAETNGCAATSRPETDDLRVRADCGADPQMEDDPARDSSSSGTRGGETRRARGSCLNPPARRREFMN